MTAPELGPGAVVAGKYQVASVLGRGGSSNTYYCRTQDGREVLVKLFDPALSQRADVMQMVEQLYGMSNTMPADLVARIVDAGYDPTTGAPFSATERVQLPSLAQLVGQRVLTPEETVMLLRALARVIDAAHACKLVHHALKPTNIFFALGANTIRITDFGAGLARLAVPTAEGYALAAPWLAPEQVQQGMQAGPAADVFTTALIAFFALTGRPYWRSCQGGLDVAGWQREIVSPRDPASARAGQVGAALNRAFDPVIGCALSVDPNQRYRSLGELAAAFENLVGGTKAPDGAHTVAFAAPPGNDYPPPPAPLGGAGGYSAASPVAGLGHGLGGPTLASAGNLGPGQSPIRPASTKIAPIVVIVAALALLGGGAAALVKMGNKTAPADSGPIAVSAPSTVASAEPTAASASGEPASSAEPAASGAASAEPAASAAPSAAASAEPAADAVEVAISCDPACDELRIDDNPVAEAERDKPQMLAPGRHKITVAKQKYYSQTETIVIQPGKKFAQIFHLVPAAKSATSSKPCGKFLKHCD